VAKVKILIVDDEAQISEALGRYLMRRSYEVDVAYDGLKAKELLKTNTYDCIIFDCNMPGLNGIELAKILKANNADTKRIMLSGYDLINEEFAKHLAIDIFLRKPISPSEIEQAIGRKP